jgi:hypothetical protein
MKQEDLAKYKEDFCGYECGILSTYFFSNPVLKIVQGKIGSSRMVQITLKP